MLLSLFFPRLYLETEKYLLLPGDILNPEQVSTLRQGFLSFRWELAYQTDTCSVSAHGWHCPAQCHQVLGLLWITCLREPFLEGPEWLWWQVTMAANLWAALPFFAPFFVRRELLVPAPKAEEMSTQLDELKMNAGSHPKRQNPQPTWEEVGLEATSSHLKWQRFKSG